MTGKFCPASRGRCEHADVCPIFGCPRDRQKRPVDALPPVVDRDRLGKVLALLASPHDGEALAATRMVVKLLAAHDMRPEQLVNGIPTSASAFHAFTFTYPAAAPRSATPKPKPAKPSWPSFRDIGPGAAADRLRQMLATPLLPKPRAFVSDILARLQRPHPTGTGSAAVAADLTTAEIRRLNSMWRLVQEVAAAFTDRAAS
jgi:hypothetical protein